MRGAQKNKKYFSAGLNLAWFVRFTNLGKLNN